MKEKLINNYTYAVVRHLPRKIRGDVEREIESLIIEMLEVRCGNDSPAESDVKAVLTELGTPEELAAKYSGDEQKFLISGVYYMYYKRILKLVIPIVATAVLLGFVISTINEITVGIEIHPALFAVRVFGQVLGGLISGAWVAFGVITVVFAMLERSKANLNSYGGDFVDVLPEAPAKPARIGISEPIFSIIVSLAFAVLFLGVPQIMGGRFDGEWVPLFGTDALRSMWVPIVVWVILGIISASAMIVEGRYTKRLAVITIVTNIMILGCAALVFLRDTVLNPYFIENIDSILNYEAPELVPWLSNSHLIVFGIVGIIVVIESVSFVVKAAKYGRSGA